MSNINQIEKDGVVYNIEDANAQRKTLVVESASYITLDDSMSTAVPSLSVQQVTNIYNAITDGKEVYIEDMLGDNRVLVSQKALPENNIAIYFSYLARLELTYTIVDEAVEITYIEIGAGGTVEVDDVTINKNADGELQLKDGGITNAKLNSALKATSISDSPSSDKLSTESAIYNYIASGNNGKPRALDGVDLNTINATGFYSCNVCTNRPTENNGVMIVLKNALTSDNTVQIYWTFVADCMWVRHKDLGSWKTWKKVLNDGDIVTAISSASTNNEIPSAKAVYDALQEVDVTTDDTTISKNTDGELQAIGLTDGSDGLTFQEIYNALTIRRHS